MLRSTRTLFVCLIVLIPFFPPLSYAWTAAQAASQGHHETTDATRRRAGSLVQSRDVIKCRPLAEARLGVHTWEHNSSGRPGAHSPSEKSEHGSECSLPEHPTGGWELTADVLFARMKGKVRFWTSTFFTFYGWDDVDLNSDLGLADHGAMPSFMAMYKFRPKWSLRYSVMPMTMMGSGQAGRSFMFGNTLYTAGQPVGIEWQHLEQRFGLVYDAVHTHSSRISLFGDYVRVNDRIQAMQMQMQMGMGGNVMDNDLNMAMAGIGLEKCLKITHNEAVLSLECIAAGAFLDDAVGAEAETAFKYSIPMNKHRRGFVKGGYRYLTYKKKVSDARLFDIAIEGGFLQAGLMF